jgi:hypothetical protein
MFIFVDIFLACLILLKAMIEFGKKIFRKKMNLRTGKKEGRITL